MSAFKQLLNQDTFVSTYIAKKSFNLAGSSLTSNNIFTFPWELYPCDLILECQYILDPSTTPTPSITATPSVTITPSVTFTPTYSVTPSNTRTVSPTRTVTPTVSLTPTNTKTPTATRTPSRTPSNTISPTSTLTPSNTITPSITQTPIPCMTLDGLYFRLDAGWPSGFNTTNDTWLDLTNSGFDAIRTGSRVIYNENNYGFDFTGTGTSTTDGIFIKNLNYVSGFADPIPNLTIEAWVKPSTGTTSHDDDERVIISFDDSAVLKFSLGRSGSAAAEGKPSLSFTTSDGIYNVIAGDFGDDLRDNEWHQVAVTFSSTAVKFYVDSRLVHTTTGSYAPIGGQFDIETPRYGWIGNDSEASTEGGTILPGNMFYGSISIINYYYKTLSEEEIQYNFNCLGFRFPATALTPTPSNTKTPSNTPTSTKTQTPTPSYTRTPTPSNTITPTETNTPTSTRTPSQTRTPSSTYTRTPTPSTTYTRTPTPSTTYTSTPTPSNTITPTETNTPTSTQTPTRTETPSPTYTRTPTPSNTITPTETNTPTSTQTPTRTETPSPTYSRTPTPSTTYTSTPTPSNTITPTETNTPTSTQTPTRTETPSPTYSRTPTPSTTFTRTPTPSNTITPTETNTPTSTRTPTRTETPSPTYSRTPTPSNTITPTETSTPTNTPSPTRTPSNFVPVFGDAILRFDANYPDIYTTLSSITGIWRDLSGNEYDGNLISAGSPPIISTDTETSGGVTIKSFYFDGSASSLLNQGIFLQDLRYVSDQTDAFPEITIEAWVKAFSTNSGHLNDQRTILSFDRTANFEFSIGTAQSGTHVGKPVFHYGYEGSTSGTYVAANTWSGNLRDDLWHQVAVVYKVNEYVKFYVDGVEIYTSPSAPTVVLGEHITAETPRLGVIGNQSSRNSDSSTSTSPGYSFHGNIGALNMYGRALNGSEIVTNFNAMRPYFNKSAPTFTAESWTGEVTITNDTTLNRDLVTVTDSGNSTTTVNRNPTTLSPKVCSSTPGFTTATITVSNVTPPTGYSNAGSPISFNVTVPRPYTVVSQALFYSGVSFAAACSDTTPSILYIDGTSIIDSTVCMTNVGASAGTGFYAQVIGGLRYYRYWTRSGIDGGSWNPGYTQC
jgi:hypothetical protein